MQARIHVTKPMYRNEWHRCLRMSWEPDIQVNSKQPLSMLWVPRVFRLQKCQSYFLSSSLSLASQIFHLLSYFPVPHLSVLESMFMATNRNYKTLPLLCPSTSLDMVITLLLKFSFSLETSSAYCHHLIFMRLWNFQVMWHKIT